MRHAALISTISMLLACGAGPEPEANPGSGSLSARRTGRASSIALPGPDYYPEGIAAGPAGALYVGSVGTGAIVRVPPASSSPRPFLPGRPAFGVYGLAVDAPRGLLWACTYDELLVPEQPARLEAYRLATAQQVASLALPGTDGFCNDVIVDRRGNVYATDSFANTVVRLECGASDLSTWASSPLFDAAPYSITLNGLVLDGSGSSLFVVRYDTGVLFSIPILPDGSAGDPQMVAVDPPLELPDGIELVQEDQLLVVEGVGRVSVVRMGPTGGSKTVLADGLLEPTTAALWAGSAWVSEGQASQLFGDEMPVLPFRVVRIPLRGR
jgi:sugar lactone lactonase YvrE